MLKVKSDEGFTLFTALLSIVLISLTWLLMSSMTNTERSAASAIDDIKQHDEMQSIIDLHRADAMQIFNFRLRLGTEEFLTQLDSDGLPTPNAFGIDKHMYNSGNISWDYIKNEFSRHFASSNVQALASRMAQHLSNIVERSTDVRGYSIDLANYVVDCTGGNCEMRASDVAKFTAILQKMNSNVANSGDLIEPIKCNGNFDDCLGTFYINMDLGELSEDDYQMLPKIKIIHIRSGRSLIEPILPRGTFRIYMPIRYFKALAGGREVAKALLNESTHNEIFGISDTGDVADPNDACTAPRGLTIAKATEIIKQKVNAIAPQLESDDFKIVKGNDGSYLAKITVNTSASTTRPDPGNPQEICTTGVSDYEAFLVYEELNPTYMVSNENSKRVLYGIRITDSV